MIESNNILFYWDGNDDDDMNDVEMDEEWRQCQEQDDVWGGRGRGGRGAYANQTNHRENIHLYHVSLSLPNGTELLDSTITQMDIQKGHRYGLIGRNGVGKSTLLKHLATHAIPGIPHNMRILYVQQQQQQQRPPSTASKPSNTTVESISAIDALVQSDRYRNKLLQEQSTIEATLEQDEGTDDCTNDTIDIMQAIERLSFIESELEGIQADTAYERAMNILIGLQFTKEMIHGSITNLSGGWRMRLSIARALFITSYDVLLFDEVTNHLDLTGLDWLIKFINQSNITMILVSHDKFFLDAVCTDMIVMEHHTLTYHVGNYTRYEQQVQEKSTREAQILDAAERQRTKAMEFIQKQQSNPTKATDPNKQRQAKMIRDKKLDRIGNYREDGKRYKLQSLKTLDEKSIRLAQKVQINVDDQPMVHLHFPNPIWAPSIGRTDSVIRLENLSLRYNNKNHKINDDNNYDNTDQTKMILNDVTVSIQRGSKIALVGSNGCGKTTLMKLLARAGSSNVATNSDDVATICNGTLWIHPTIRIGHVSQYSVEEMEMYAHLTVLEYAEQNLMSGRAAADIVTKASHNVRQYLGGFGLGGKHALQLIGKLSGGERMRLCFAKVLADNPNILLLDESTNHCDIQLLESLADALRNFTGAVVMVSHNQSFLSGFCNELWVLGDGNITVNHSDTVSFDEIFSHYRNNITNGTATSLANQRRQKTALAKRATNQRAGTKQNIGLL